jgi:DNA-directed RNA polymerase subunit alpha
VSQAAGILNEHLSLFSVNGDPVIEEEETTTSEAVEEEMHTRESLISDDFYEEEPMAVNISLLKNVEELELSVRSYNCLKNANILTLADLVQKTEQEMLRTKNFGRKSLNEIKEIIQSMGLNFNMRVDVDELQKLASAKRTENAS